MESCLKGKNEGGKGNEKLYVLERKNKKGIFVSIGSIFLFFDWWVIFANMGVILTPLTN